MAATDRVGLTVAEVAGHGRRKAPDARPRWIALMILGLLPALARAAVLPGDRADVMYHYYDGGGDTDELAAALAEFRTDNPVRDPGRVPRPFRPRNFTVDPAWADGAATGRPLRVAVLPFLADTRDREIGDVVASQIVRRLLDVDGLDVLEPGVVREALLESRVIQDDGPSLSQVDALRAVVDVDLVVSGRVTDFEPLGTAPGSPFLGFSVRGIDTRARQAVFTSFSFGRGDDRVGPFGALRIRSPLTLTSELARGVVDALHDELRVRRPPARASATKEPPR